jgi:2-keto-4-pentenoate hydratase
VSELVPRLAKFSDALRDANRTRIAIAPLTESDPDLTVDDAYAIQLHNIDRAVADGHRILGHKVGLTSRAMQEMLGVHEPDFGVLLDDMVLPDGAEVSLRDLVHPRVEAEIGLRLAEDLRGPGVTIDRALAALDVAMPALEIIDSRIADWRIGLVDTIADNGSSARAVFGTKSVPAADLDLRLVGAVLERNGELVEHGVGAAALGHPAACVAWLANKLAGFDQTLRAGELILPGAVHRAIDVVAGDVVRAELAGLGTVTVRFVD